jgi:hypothetical protein
MSGESDSQHELIVDVRNATLDPEIKKILTLIGLKARVDCEIKPPGATAPHWKARRESKTYAPSTMGLSASILDKRGVLLSLVSALGRGCGEHGMHRIHAPHREQLCSEDPVTHSVLPSDCYFRKN